MQILKRKLYFIGISKIHIRPFCISMVCNVICPGRRDHSMAPQTRLSWANFKAEPIEGSKIAATTASGMSYQFSTTEEDGKYELDYTISTYFYPG